MKRWLVPTLLLALAACPSPSTAPSETVSLQQDPPGPALEAFFTDLRYQRIDEAWNALSEASRDWLETRHRALRHAQTGTVSSSDMPDDLDRSKLLYRTLDLRILAPPENIVVVSPPGTRVTLRVSSKGGASAEFVMVREDSRWKVDLLRTLKLE
ncbi:MAG: hypothetical protein ACFB9M_10885 [Myxococcota bacterium]